MEHARNLFIKFIFLLTLGGCHTPIEYTYSQPKDIGDGLNVSTLEKVLINTETIFDAVRKIHNKRFKEVHSLLILKDNKLVLEEYFSGHAYKWIERKHHGELKNWDMTTEHWVHSVTKSITSLCIGIALDHSFIKSINDSIVNYLPKHQHLLTDGKQNITIEHLITMTSGLDWDEWSTSPSSNSNDIVGIWQSSNDPLSFILNRKLIAPPGTHFSYNGGGIILLGEILKNASGLSIAEFSDKYLFQPLGISAFSWPLYFNNGVYEAAGGLTITPRGMAKIGLMMLNNGVWKNTQIISRAWVDSCKVPYRGNVGIDVSGEDSTPSGYGYTWWNNIIYNKGEAKAMYCAGGWGGQYIMVIPELNTVIVFTGGNYKTYTPTHKILYDYIAPAL